MPRLPIRRLPPVVVAASEVVDSVVEVDALLVAEAVASAVVAVEAVQPVAMLAAADNSE